MVTGIIQQSDSRFTLVDLGKVEALLPPYEQVPRERYKHGERIKCYISDVRKTTKGPQVIISRTHPGLIRKLFELEVPEIYEGIVEIKSVAREAGYRTKIAVSSNEKNVDPVGACVGPKGSRVKMVVEELGGEKIDIVEYSDDIVTFIKNALSPARVLKVLTDEDKKFALIVVSSDQLSLAIGREGQNARLAAKLTGWKIDIKSERQFEEELDEAREERSKSKGEDTGVKQ
jgi:N utilization substance protein A